VCALLLLAVAEILLTEDQFSVRPHLAAALTAACAMCGSLWWRRSRPLLPVVVSLAAVSASAAADIAPQAWLLPQLCTVAYSVGGYARGWESGTGLAGSVLTGWVIARSAVDGSDPTDYVWTAAMLGVSWAAGTGLRRRQEAAAEDRESALAEQRARIARELHDVVAHSLTVVVMTADAAELACRTEPQLAAEPLRTIRRVAQEALDEMRRLVGILRAVDQAERRDPQPRLLELDTLVEAMRASGMQVTLSIDGDIGGLPPGVDLAAYRIVQEALTNARRHTAAGSRAWVRVRRDADSVQLEIVNDGAARPGTAGSGNGIIGLRERVALYGGDFDAAPLIEGGFRVAASLPLAEVRR
jgi:signal transduction histidine kinase